MLLETKIKYMLLDIIVKMPISIKIIYDSSLVDIFFTKLRVI